MSTRLKIQKSLGIVGEVSLSINRDMGALLALNVAAVSAGSWEPLLPVADRRFRRLGEDNAFWVQGMAPDGKIVCAQAAVLLDCRERSFGHRLADLSVFYDYPGNAPAGEWCRCDSPAAYNTTGRTVWTVGGWIHPDYRGKGLFGPLGKVTREQAEARWSPDWIVGVVDEGLTSVWSEAKAGTRWLDPTPTIFYNMAGLGLLRMHFMRFAPVGQHLLAA